mmetsp:Transcript_14453/g.41392  ORF Transcript_14453/g.41392 Transcript_14453/m.41392 type:complete len:201 (+) Transcript_14453:241-843(+)
MAPLPSRSKAFDQASSIEPCFLLRSFWKSVITTCLRTGFHSWRSMGSRATSALASKTTPERLTESRCQTLSHQARPPPNPKWAEGCVRTRWKPPARWPGTTKAWSSAGRHVCGRESRGRTSWLSHAARSSKVRSSREPCSTTNRLPPTSQQCSRTVSAMAMPRPVLKRRALRSSAASVPRTPRPRSQPSGVRVSVTRCGR